MFLSLSKGLKYVVNFQNRDAGDSDSEAEQEKLDELETLMKEYDPEFTE